MQEEPMDFTGPPGVRKKLSATNCDPLGVTGTGWVEIEEWEKRSQTHRQVGSGVVRRLDGKNLSHVGAQRNCGIG